MDFRRPNKEMYGVPDSTDSFNGMPYRKLGRTGLRASDIGLGTWKMGYPETGDGARINERDSLDILDRAPDIGVTFWDTANRYNNASGNSERIIGTWMKQNPSQRRNIVLCTKLRGGMDGISPNHGGLSRANILESTYASLARMELDYVDVMYFHRPDNNTEAEESLLAMEDLIRQDLVRYFAVSNFDEALLDEYKRAGDAISGRVRIAAVQNRFDILNGENGDANVLGWCARNGASFIAYSPLARGLLTERYLDLSKMGPGDRLFDEGALSGIAQTTVARMRRLNELAVSWEMPLAVLSLAYMLTLPGMGPAIPSASSVAQLEQNAMAGKAKLTAQQLEAVREALK